MMINNDVKKKYIIEQLRINKGIDNELKTKDLEYFLVQFNIETKSLSKKELVEWIINDSSLFNSFIEKYQFLFTVPDFRLKKIFDLPSIKVVHELELQSVFPPGIEEEFNPLSKKAFRCRTYPIAVLDLDIDFVQAQVRKYNLKDIKIRIDLNDLTTLPQIIKGLEDFMVLTNSNTVMKNGQDGNYCYITGCLKRGEK